MAFSKPITGRPPSRTLTPSPPGVIRQQDSSTPSSVDHPKARRVPFALSFSSATLMRVISPPLHLTPAILQAVRTSWPRGVVSEKKIAENSFEFKLKGYKWFQQDTFATDSLIQILSLLTSLDSHSFTLLTSISLTNRSRVKDLWIFTGPSSDDSAFLDTPEDMSTELLGNGLRRLPGPGLHSTSSTPHSNHRRLATEPPSGGADSSFTSLQRATSVDYGRQQPQVLRKPAPRAQVPVSVIQDDGPDEHHVPVRTNLPSMISTGAENMTGIGSGGHGPSPGVYYAASPHDGGQPMPLVSFPASPRPQKAPASPPGHGRPPLRPVSDRAKTPPLLVSNSPPGSPTKTPPSPTKSRKEYDFPAYPKDNGGLLGAGVFRDSAFSSQSEVSTDVPIKWTGPLNDDLMKPLREQVKMEQGSRPRPKHSRSSSGPALPGGWQSSPIEEQPELFSSATTSPSEEKPDQLTPIHENESRFSGPSLIQPDMDLRKSEAAMVTMIHATTPPHRQKAQRKESSTSTNTTGGQGWVLVNVENSPSTTGSPLGKVQSSPTDRQASPAAKAIGAVDAMESSSTHKKGRTMSFNKGSNRSGVRRFFSLTRKTPKRGAVEEEGPAGVVVAPDATTLPRANLRERLRMMGTPEAARRDDKRVSID